MMLYLKALTCLLLAAGASACSSPRDSQPAPLVLYNHVEAAGGWRVVRHNSLDRSIWFCLNPAEATWEHLAVPNGLDPLEYQWWVRDIDGRRVTDPQPELGKRYTLPNRVYIVMGDASFHSPIELVPYVGRPVSWLLDWPEALWGHVTRPIGALCAFRPNVPQSEGYKVVAIRDARRRDLAEIFGAPDTYGIIYFGHGNPAGLSTYGAVWPDFISIYSIRILQNHRFGKAVLNSCHSTCVAEGITGPTGAWKAQQGYHFAPIGMQQW